MTTPIQQKIYSYIKSFIAQEGYSPSLSEVASGIGISPNSISLISRSIHALVKEGKLSFHRKGYRNIRVNEEEVGLPILGRIAAGKPIAAIPDEQMLDLRSLLKAEQHFLLKVDGDSMVEEGIYDGDYVICKQAESATEGDIVVALIDHDETTLKRISYRIQDRITLIPANTLFKPKAYLPHRVHIQGVYVGLFRFHSRSSKPN